MNSLTSELNWALVVKKYTVSCFQEVVLSDTKGLLIMQEILQLKL